MKSTLLLAVMAILLCHVGYAQTKGTRALGFGVNVNTTTNSNGNGLATKTRENFFTLGYGHFISENQKIGVDLQYSSSKYDNNVSNGYLVEAIKTKGRGVSVNYQHYYPLFKKLFAFAGGNAGYFASRRTGATSFNNLINSDNYTLGARGGVTWFLGKRFALETSLLAADISYQTSKVESHYENQFNSTKSTSFNLSTSGVINDLGFKIYLLF
jgi:hypothetical protein